MDLACFNPLKAYRQFIHWKLYAGGVKRPVDSKTLIPVSITDSNNWKTYDDVVRESATAKDLRIGFVLTKDDPFFFVDVDTGFDSKLNDWKPLAKTLVNQFKGAAVEVSSSGKGLHIIGSGICPPHVCKYEDTEQQVKLELYDHSRFIALTGYEAFGNAAQDFSQVLPNFIQTYFPITGHVDHLEWWDQAREDWNGYTDDDDLIHHAIQSRSAGSAFGLRASFEDLWTCNIPVLTKAYPPSENSITPYDASSADRALAQHLAFWTGCNHERIKSLMFQSALTREKWQREDYLRITISGAVDAQREVHKRSEKTTPGAIPAPQSLIYPSLVEGNPFLSIEDQINLFAGCVYIEDSHKILLPGGLLASPPQFKAIYGGYVFTMGAHNSKVTTDAWLAFSESQAYRKPRVQTTYFRPSDESSKIIEEEGIRMVNIWYPPVIRLTNGPTVLFDIQIKKLFPDDRDREIILSYLAALVQYPGVKFRWCVLLQGMEGNGKTLLAKVAAAAIGRRYTHFADAVEINEKFNAWLFGNLLIVINEVYTSNRWELVEKLKTYISEEIQDIRAMRENRVSREICCNFILSSNYKESITRTANDRRYATFYTPQQSIEDLQRDEMCEEYFSELFNWLRYQDGYAKIAYYLNNYPIRREFNPKYLSRAPQTTSSDEAFEISRDRVELEVLEAVEQGLIGFRGGWISSAALDNLIASHRFSYKVSRNRRIEILKNLSYIKHPGLTDGRVNNLIMPDGCKPRLYIKSSHADRSLTIPIEIAKKYTEAQS